MDIDVRGDAPDAFDGAAVAALLLGRALQFRNRATLENQLADVIGQVE